MLDFLFGGLTARPARGAALFDGVTRLTRAPHWYVEGKVPDTLDGRFAVLATVTAQVLVRLETPEEMIFQQLSVALTERFIDVMESEHRELGIGDPALGRKVRKLVGSLARRVDLWRATTTGERPWEEAAAESLSVEGDGKQHCAAELRKLWQQLQSRSIEQLSEGEIG